MWTRYFGGLLALLILVPSCVGTLPPAFAGSADLSWNANTESDLAGYKLYQGTSSGKYGTPIDLGNVTTYIVALPELATDQTYFWCLSAYDRSGNESGLSNEASKLIAGVPITPPTPTSFPLKFKGTVGETQTVTIPVTIPAGATAASLVIACYDCDHSDWGTLSINTGKPMPMWANPGPGNALSSMTIPVQVSAFVTGTNTLTFVQTSNYGGPRIDGVSVTFTVPDTTAPANPTGLRVK